MADLLRGTTVTASGFFRSAFASIGDALELETVIGFGMPCEGCGDFVEAELSLSDFDAYGVLCGGRRCLAGDAPAAG